MSYTYFSSFSSPQFQLKVYVKTIVVEIMILINFEIYFELNDFAIIKHIIFEYIQINFDVFYLKLLLKTYSKEIQLKSTNVKSWTKCKRHKPEIYTTLNGIICLVVCKLFSCWQSNTRHDYGIRVLTDIRFLLLRIILIYW